MTATSTSPAVEGPWSPLRIAVYRSLWLAGVVSNIGTFMHITAAGWSMSQLSGSPLLTGLVQTAWAVPGVLLALHAGAFADLVDRRRLLIATELVALVIAASLAAFEWSETMTPSLLIAGTFLESVALSLSAPAFMAVTPHLVGPDRLPQAIGLDAISRNAATAVGPALAGVVLLRHGPGAVFMLNAVSFLGVVAVVYRRRSGWGGAVPASGVRSAISSGVRLVVNTAALHRPVLRISLSTFAAASILAVLPLFATERLGVSSRGYGVLSAGIGIGSVAAVWVLPRLKAHVVPERATIGSALTWSAGAAVLASSEGIWTALIGVVLAGAGAMGVINVLFSNYMLRMPHDMRGRGAALVMMMVWLGTSVGASVWGAVASASSLVGALLAAAATNAVVAVAMPLLLRVHSADPPAPAAP